MIIIGIDPGKSGAVAIYREGETLDNQWEFFDTPETVEGMDSVIPSRLVASTNVFIERVHAMPGQGVCSMFSFGQNYGQWQGIIAARGYKVTHVAPQTWKKAMLADMPKEKFSSVQRALQLYPHLVDSFKRKKDHNRADALLITEWGRRQICGSVGNV